MRVGLHRAPRERMIGRRESASGDTVELAMPRRSIELLALSTMFASIPFACSSGGGTVDLFAHDAARDGRVDTGRDSGTRDTSTRDTATSDVTSFDANVTDTSSFDVVLADAPVVDAHVECTVSGPTSIGPIPAGLVVDDATVGTRAWTTPNNARFSDDATASISAMVSGEESHYLLASNFGFDIPAGAAITGFTVQAERRASGSFNVVDNYVRIVKGGNIGAQDRATGPAWSGFDSTSSYGGASDTWGLAFTPDDVNASNFGVAFSARYAAGAAGNGYAYVDQIRVTVHLSCP